MRTIIVTVGTSLLSNAQRALKKKKPSDEELVHYLRSKSPQEATAEMNSLEQLLQEGDHLIFLHSQTPEGERCARLLSRHYERKGYRVEVVEISDLTYKESRFKMRGLRSLVATMVKLIEEEREQGREVLINATGGFKAEIAYATLVGLLFDVPVYYIHEAFQDIVDMPPVPISWDYSLFADHEEFFSWLEDDLRPVEEVEQKLRNLPAEVRLLLSEEDGFVMLSPAGEAFYRDFKRRSAEAEKHPILISKQAEDALRQMDEEERQLISGYLKRLRLPEWRFHNSEVPEGSDCLVAPRGRINWRILYYEGEDRSLKVLEIVRHETYERLLKRRVRRESYPQEDFSSWQV